MIEVSDTKTFALTNEHFSYVFRVTPEGLLEHVYYGGPLQAPLEVMQHHERVQRECTIVFQGTPYFNLSDTPQEYPVFGTSDYRYPAFHGINPDGNSVFTFTYKNHQIIDGKPDLTGLPASRAGRCRTLIVTLQDFLYGLEIALYYTIYEAYGVLVRSCKIVNKSDKILRLQNVFSSSIDFPADDYEILHLHGSWAREFTVERMELPSSRFVIESSRGASSAVHNPFIALLEKGTSEAAGRVYATSLVYSGNFALSLEHGEFGDVRLLAGINPFNFGWRLMPGEVFATPEALHLYTDKGLREMSHIWHDFIRDKISPPQFRHQPRPTYLNTWEAAYFDVSEEKVLELADVALDIDIEMLVLDDGWFEGRRDDTTSLGDWVADRERFPSGIPALARAVQAKGLKFGLWLEPEMINAKSLLFEKYPDWALHVPGRPPSLGRSQLTLDLSRPDVVAYLYDLIHEILSCGAIDYVKWDMNRNVSELGSAGYPMEQQGEVAHRYYLGLYGLIERLTTEFPQILFENCASGGNRFDLGMLRYMAQNWPSDMCDPIGRLSIITGLSYLFPLDVTTAYIGPSPNHQNGRETSIETRFNAGALCAARGISLNETEIAQHEPLLRALMRFARKTAPDLVGGRFDRLITKENEICWQYTSRDEMTVFLAYFHILSGPNMPFRRARMVGLDPGAIYHLQDSEETYSGEALMQSGMKLPYVTTAQTRADIRYMKKGDFSSHLFVFKQGN